MELLRTKLIQELREAREELLNINFHDNKPTFVNLGEEFGNEELSIPPPPPGSRVKSWTGKWSPTFKRVDALSHGLVKLHLVIPRQMGGFEKVNDPEILNELRPLLVQHIDDGIRVLDQGYKVKPLLEDYTKRVKDTKLAELLKEFNSTKNTAPNLAAMGFRTILCLIIQEKAKRVNPTSKTATRTDLSPQPVIDCARNEQILSQDEQRLVNSFVSTHKDIYDFVTHRPTILIDKNEVDTMVDLLNKLLPAIIN